jgi:putative thioredoxin
VQSIPAVYALKDGQIVDGFMGALPEHEVRQFVERLLPTAEDDMVARMIAMGDEGSLRAALEVDPANEDAIVALAELLIARGENEEALALVARIPESDRTRRVAAKARLGVVDDDHDETLTGLLDKVKTDDDARQQYVDILELMGPDDPRTSKYRKLLTQRLF